MGSILDRAKADASNIIKSGGFESDITLKNDTEELATTGLFINRTDSIQYEDGADKLEPFAHLTISLDDLPESTIENGKVNLTGWKVEYSGTTYAIKEIMPNRTINVIAIKLLQL